MHSKVHRRFFIPAGQERQSGVEVVAGWAARGMRRRMRRRMEEDSSRTAKLQHTHGERGRCEEGRGSEWEGGHWWMGLSETQGTGRWAGLGGGAAKDWWATGRA